MIENLLLRALKEMEKRGFNPGVVTMGCILDGFARSGDWKRALGVLQGLKDRGIPISNPCYGACIQACGNGGVNFSS